jgi:hypothetical protein
MRRHLALLICAWLSGIGCHTEPAKLAAPKAVLCIPQGKWPELLSTMRTFGASHNLKFMGGTEVIGTADKDRPLLNASLAQGYDYRLGDDLDLWATSRPFEPEIVDLAAVVKRPATMRQRALAKAFLAELARIGPPAERNGSRNSCR